MSIFEIIIVAVALALDALIVSMCYGLKLCSNRVKYSILLAVFFGFFQFIMPILGWYFTGFVYEMLELYSKWIVFAIFMFLALKFLKSAFEKDKKEEVNCISYMCILMLAIATSIDAFGVGITFKFLNTGIMQPSIIIGLITLGLAFIGFWLAGVFKRFSSDYVEVIGALLLIYLAVKAII